MITLYTLSLTVSVVLIVPGLFAFGILSTCNWDSERLLDIYVTVSSHYMLPLPQRRNKMNPDRERVNLGWMIRNFFTKFVYFEQILSLFSASLMSDNREGSCGSSPEGASKNVLFLIAGDCLFRRDKTDFSDYQQSFQENICKISQRFFQNSLSSTIVKSVLIDRSLIEELRGVLSDISCESGIETSERTERFYTVNDNETQSSSSGNLGARIPLTTAALFITRQANYSKS